MHKNAIKKLATCDLPGVELAAAFPGERSLDSNTAKQSKVETPESSPEKSKVVTTPLKAIARPAPKSPESLPAPKQAVKVPAEFTGNDRKEAILDKVEAQPDPGELLAKDAPQALDLDSAKQLSTDSVSPNPPQAKPLAAAPPNEHDNTPLKKPRTDAMRPQSDPAKAVAAPQVSEIDPSKRSADGAPELVDIKESPKKAVTDSAIAKPDASKPVAEAVSQEKDQTVRNEPGGRAAQSLDISTPNDRYHPLSHTCLVIPNQSVADSLSRTPDSVEPAAKTTPQVPDMDAPKHLDTAKKQTFDMDAPKQPMHNTLYTPTQTTMQVM